MGLSLEVLVWSSVKTKILIITAFIQKTWIIPKEIPKLLKSEPVRSSIASFIISELISRRSGCIVPLWRSPLWEVASPSCYFGCLLWRRGEENPEESGPAAACAYVPEAAAGGAHRGGADVSVLPIYLLRPQAYRKKEARLAAIYFKPENYEQTCRKLLWESLKHFNRGGGGANEIAPCCFFSCVFLSLLQQTTVQAQKTSCYFAP